jgi:hypothetical protein
LDTDLIFHLKSLQDFALANTLSDRPSFKCSTMPNLTFDRFIAFVIQPIDRKLNTIELHDAKMAHLCCRLIPAQCPFEREIHCCGRTLHIPPLCKLNPFYDRLVELRFKALCYLADVCGEDIANYC